MAASGFLDATVLNVLRHLGEVDVRGEVAVFAVWRRSKQEGRARVLADEQHYGTASFLGTVACCDPPAGVEIRQKIFSAGGVALLRAVLDPREDRSSAYLARHSVLAAKALHSILCHDELEHAGERTQGRLRKLLQLAQGDLKAGVYAQEP